MIKFHLPSYAHIPLQPGFWVCKRWLRQITRKRKSINLAQFGDGTFDVMLPYLLSVWNSDGFHVGQEKLEEAAASPHSTLLHPGRCLAQIDTLSRVELHRSKTLQLVLPGSNGDIHVSTIPEAEKLIPDTDNLAAFWAGIVRASEHDQMCVCRCRRFDRNTIEDQLRGQTYFECCSGKYYRLLPR